jgi:poly(3-hydroxybutyrate) depolymerase
VKNRLLIIVLAAAMMVPLTGFAPATDASGLPPVQQLSATTPVYDPMAGIKMGISGLFERTISGTNRTAKLYVPKAAHLGASMVVLNVPEGERTVSWLVESGWIDLAEKNKFILYVFEPGASGRWGSPDDELSYLETAYANISVNSPDGRGTWYLPPESYYVVGYDGPGSVLQQIVMKDPTLVAAATFVNASDIDTAFLEQLDSRFYPTPDWNGRQVASSSVPLPVWIMEDGLDAKAAGVVRYRQDANQTETKSTGFHGGRIFHQRKGALKYYVADGSLSAVAVAEKVKNAAGIYDDFLSRYTRYGGNVGGNTLGSRPDYDKLGVQFKTMELAGRLREYMVYVPAKAKQAASKGKNVPAVVSLHGSGLTMYSMFDFSRWWEVADDEGFILVVPTGLNTQNRTGWGTTAGHIDMTFLQLLLDEVKAGYNVDPGRIYLGGQSNGSMTTIAAGKNLALSKNFAALGATSGGQTSSTTDYTGETLPFFVLFGEFDFWPADLSTPYVGETMRYWINRNDALGTPTTPASVERAGRYDLSSWKDANGTTVAKFGVTRGRGHSTIADEARVLWDWYTQWHKDAQGNNVQR